MSDHLPRRSAAVIALVVSLALAWLLAGGIAAQVSSRWFLADLTRHSRATVQASAQSMLDEIDARRGSALDSLAERLAADPQILGVAVCIISASDSVTRARAERTSSPERQRVTDPGAQGASQVTTAAKSTLYPSDDLPCAKVVGSMRERELLPTSIASWQESLPGAGMTVHLSAVPLGEAPFVAFAVVVQRTDEVFSRRRTVAALLFAIIAAVLLLAFWFSTNNQRNSLERWVAGFRKALRGDGSEPEYNPLISEIRAVMRPAQVDGALSGHWSRERVKRLLHDQMHDTQVIVVANREPYVHERTEQGVRILRPASGLVTALDPVMRTSAGVWVAHGAGSADRETVDANDRLRVPPGEDSYTLRRVWLTEEEEQGYYYGFANEGLWPLCHIVHVRPSFRASDWKQYGTVNWRFANAVSEEATSPDPVVLVQDYHFALAPSQIRQLLPDATIVAFWHIPWPNSERFGISPWREELLEGLLGADIVGFHTQAHCNNFMDAVDAYLEARVDRGDASVTRRGRNTLVRAYPISIEWPRPTHIQVAPVDECRRNVLREYNLPDNTILTVGVDRLDYTKGLNERLLAVEALLDSSPDLVGKFVLLQIAAPSRTRIQRYKEHEAEVQETADRINARFAMSPSGYRPIRLEKEHRGAAKITELYRAADICYVSSLHDGMNLVAKEFVAARDDERGVLVLSQFAGVSREFTEALIVNPYDIEKAAAALGQGVRMSPDEQRARMHALRSQLSEFNVYRWAGRMLGDAAALRKRVKTQSL